VRHVNWGKMDSLHLDSSSFHVDGNYINNTACEEAQPEGIEITYGYSRDPSRPEAIYFRLDVQWGWGYSLYLRVGDGNESDSAMFATLLADFKRQWQIDALFVADAALTPEESATNVSFALGVESTRHPDCCKNAVREHARRSI